MRVREKKKQREVGHATAGGVKMPTAKRLQCERGVRYVVDLGFKRRV